MTDGDYLDAGENVTCPECELSAYYGDDDPRKCPHCGAATSNLERIEALLRAWGACFAAQDWVAKHAPDTTLQELWDACPEASWLYWLAWEAAFANEEDTKPACYAYWVAGRSTTAIGNPELYRSRMSCPDLSRYGIK